MMELTVYDPALCCSTGVCGPAVDPALVQFAADLEWARARGAQVRRYNLAQEPAAFARNALVRRKLQDEGTACLPLLIVGGEIVSAGRYPRREEIEAWSLSHPDADGDALRLSGDSGGEGIATRSARSGLVVLGGGGGIAE